MKVEDRYMDALRGHLLAPNESTLADASDIGRAALIEGRSLLDMFQLHQRSVQLVGSGGAGILGSPAEAAAFFAETLTAYEMALRGYREANASLVAMNSQLQARNQELARARESADALWRDLEAFSHAVSLDPNLPLMSMDALLSLARVSRGELEPRPVDLAAIAKEVVADLRYGAPERVVDVRISEPMEAMADPALARTLLEALIGNAWKFTRDTEGAVIEVGRDPSDRAFFVRDNGAGFDMSGVSRLFTPFQRLHTSAEFGGSGIGLATAHRIVRRHGGRIWAEGAPGQGGATFHFTLEPDRHKAPGPE